jgi:DNA-binding transcriptional LysR family regulator
MNFRHLDLNLLRVFDVVMVERNLTRAAERLSVTQPAVSNALRRLQDTLGEELLTRAASGVAPTPRAEALWPEVRAALSHLRDAFEPVAFDPARDAATFGIAMADATAAILLPELVGRIELCAAKTDVRVVPLATHDPRALLDRGDADLAIGYFPEALAALELEDRHATFGHAPLLESDYVCVMRAGHPLAAAELTLDAYCAAHHLVASVAGRPHGLVDRALSAIGRERRVVLTVNQYFTAGRVVAQSDLLAAMPTAFLAATGSGDLLVTRPLPVELPPLRIAMLWHRRHERSPAHQWLREQLARGSGLPAKGDRPEVSEASASASASAPEYAAAA